MIMWSHESKNQSAVFTVVVEAPLYQIWLFDEFRKRTTPPTLPNWTQKAQITKIYDCILQNYTDAKQLVAQCRHYSPRPVIHPGHFPPLSTQFTGDNLYTVPHVSEKVQQFVLSGTWVLRLNFLPTVSSTDAGVCLVFFFPLYFDCSATPARGAFARNLGVSQPDFSVFSG